jgi:hypothetical protein
LNDASFILDVYHSQLISESLFSGWDSVRTIGGAGRGSRLHHGEPHRCVVGLGSAVTGGSIGVCDVHGEVTIGREVVQPDRMSMLGDTVKLRAGTSVDAGQGGLCADAG